jgi:hypothetical protein
MRNRLRVSCEGPYWRSAQLFGTTDVNGGLIWPLQSFEFCGVTVATT